jgi:hypothetical protein
MMFGSIKAQEMSFFLIGYNQLNAKENRTAHYVFNSLLICKTYFPSYLISVVLFVIVQ